jgi:hypothetical protein
MQKIAPYLANGRAKTCWGFGQPFAVRHGQAQAIVGDEGRLYCSRIGCEEAALVPLVHALQHAGAVAHAA